MGGHPDAISISYHVFAIFSLKIALQIFQKHADAGKVRILLANPGAIGVDRTVSTPGTVQSLTEIAIPYF